LEEIDRKINAKLVQLAKPDTFSGMKELSRQEMDLEQAISRDRDKSKLLGCLLTERKPSTTVSDPNHPINHLDDIVQEVMTRKRKGGKSAAVRHDIDESDTGSADKHAVVATCAERKDCNTNLTENVSEMSTCEETNALVLDCYKSNPWVVVESVSDRMAAVSSLLNPQKAVASESGQKVVVSIPVDEIERARLSPQEIKTIPKFRNYEPGEPTKVFVCLKLNIISNVLFSHYSTMYIGNRTKVKTSVIFSY